MLLGAPIDIHERYHFVRWRCFASCIEPESKLATTRCWHATRLPVEFGIADLRRDGLIAETAGTHSGKVRREAFEEGWLVLFDSISCCFEGATCPLAPSARAGIEREADFKSTGAC